MDAWLKFEQNLPITTPTTTNKLQIGGAANINPANTSLNIPYAVLFDNAHQSATDIVLSDVYGGYGMFDRSVPPQALVNNCHDVF